MNNETPASPQWIPIYMGVQEFPAFKKYPAFSAPPTRKYKWKDAYTFFNVKKSSVEYPWLTFRELQQECRKRRIKSPRKKADVKTYCGTKNNFNGTHSPILK